MGIIVKQVNMRMLDMDLSLIIDKNLKQILFVNDTAVVYEGKDSKCY